MEQTAGEPDLWSGKKTFLGERRENRLQILKRTLSGREGSHTQPRDASTSAGSCARSSHTQQHGSCQVLAHPQPSPHPGPGGCESKGRAVQSGSPEFQSCPCTGHPLLEHLTPNASLSQPRISLCVNSGRSSLSGEGEGVGL